MFTCLINMKGRKRKRRVEREADLHVSQGATPWECCLWQQQQQNMMSSDKAERTERKEGEKRGGQTGRKSERKGEERIKKKIKTCSQALTWRVRAAEATLLHCNTCWLLLWGAAARRHGWYSNTSWYVAKIHMWQQSMRGLLCCIVVSNVSGCPQESHKNCEWTYLPTTLMVASSEAVTITEKTGWKMTRVTGARCPLRAYLSGGRGIHSLGSLFWPTGPPCVISSFASFSFDSNSMTWGTKTQTNEIGK